MNKNINILVLILCMIYWGCSECSNDEKVGEYTLSQQSLNYSPYENSDTIIYEDQNELEIKLIAETLGIGKGTVRFKQTEQSGTCSILNEYFATESKNVTFLTDNRLLVMQIKSEILIELHDNKDSIAVIENLMLWYSNKIGPNLETFTFDIITNELENKVSNSYIQNELNQATYIGDTVLMNENYVNVFMFENEIGSQFYYNLEKGPFLIEFSENNYWKLK